MNPDGTHGPEHVTDEGIELMTDRSQVVEDSLKAVGHWIVSNGLRLPDPAVDPHDENCPGCIVEELARQLEQVEAERDRYREALEDDAQHHVATVAGLLRIHDDPQVVELGDRLAACVKRLRLALDPDHEAKLAALHPKERDDG